MKTMRFTRRSTLVLFSLMLVSAGRVSADDVCPRTPQWGQVPNVWDLAPTEVCGAGASAPCAVTQLRARNDGRWAGAAQVPLTNGDAGGRVRFLEGNDGALYASLEIETTGTDREVFWLGWAPATATTSADAWLLEVSIRPSSLSPNPEMQLLEQKKIACGATSCPAGATCTATACPALTPDPTDNSVISYRLLRGVNLGGNPLSVFQWDGPAFDKTVAAAVIAPAAGPGSRAWHGPLYVGAAGPPTAATVVLRIPNTLFGAATAADQKVWVAAAACDFLGAGPVNCAAQGNWPSAGEVVELATNQYTAPALTDWGLLHRTSPASCAAQPTLASAGVQTGATVGAPYNPSAAFTWPQQIVLDNNGNPADDKPNWFAARVTFPSATSDPNKYRARYFTADWGSQIGNLSVSQWTEIGQLNNPGLGVGAPTGNTEHIALQWPPSGSSAAAQKVLACKYSNCSSAVPGCPYPNNAPPPDPCAGIAGARTHHPHQCTQVKLEAIGSNSYQFAQDSMIFNTDFVGASVFWRMATISTAGIKDVTPALAPAPPEGRDIYIHVNALNLPSQADGTPIEATLGRLDKFANVVGKPPGNRPPPSVVVFARALRERLGQGHTNGPDEQRQAMAIGQVRALPLDIVRAVAPTLEFDVYYDTGRLMDTSGGKKSRWLAPMTSFRYVVEHIVKTGDQFGGWEWALDGAHPLGNGWFHIRLADGDKKNIRTRVQAVEAARMPAGNPVWPPGSAWVSPATTKPSSTTVKVTKKRGCSVGDDGTSGLVLVLVVLAMTVRRRRSR